MSLDINDIVISALNSLGYSGSRYITSRWDTSSNTAYVQIGSTYLDGYYLSNDNITVSFDDNGYLDEYSESAYIEGLWFNVSGVHLITYPTRQILEAIYDQIEAREQAEALITQEINQIRGTFDANYYLEKYSDLQAVLGNDTEAALDHYVRYGKDEGRTDVNEAEVLITQEMNELRDSFDAEYYLAKYSALEAVLGNDTERALDHYVRHGKDEGRTYLNTLPTDITLDSFSVSESSSGSHIGNLSGTDPENDALSYGIVGGTDAEMFAIVSNMLHLASGKAADYETKNQLFVELSATDIGGLSYNETFTINVTDVDETQLTVYGSSGNDVLDSFSGYGVIDGGAGVDRINYSLSNSNVSFSLNSDDQLVIQGSAEQIDALTAVERIQFTDTAYALDTDGNAGIAAKVIISAFGSENLSSYMSSILSVVDNGKTIESLSDYVINLGLIDAVTDSATNASFVDHVFENVVGRSPNSLEQAIYTDYLDNGTYTKSSLLALTANTTLTANLVTANSVDLIGVAGSADGEMLAIQYDLGLV
jgi:hypothetical protein